MKASAVTQSFKALASKINNQVPLGAKESNQLLTALTSSFRKHLDEVHPSKPHDDGKRPAVGAASQKTNRHDMHSSALLADKHMATMLTNPLLVRNAKPVPEAKPDESAAIELKNGANPFDLLESYHAKGCATVEVALCVMRHFRLSIKALSYEDKVLRVQAEEAGSRVLSWLRNSQVMYSQAYVDNNQIQDGLVWLLMTEGHEETLWQWLNSALELQQPTWATAEGILPDRGCTWKSRILYAMVMTKLGAPNRQAHSADAALNIYFRAVHNVRGTDSGTEDKMILASHAKEALDRALTHGYSHHYYNTSPLLYDRFCAIYSSHHLTHNPKEVMKAASAAWHRALLDLWHPTRPKGDGLYDILSLEPSDKDKGGVFRVHESIRDLRTERERAHHINSIARAAILLKTAGQFDKHARLLKLVRNPEHIKQVENAIGSMYAKGLNIPPGGQASPQKRQKQPAKQRPQQVEELKDFGWLPPYSPAPT